MNSGADESLSESTPVELCLDVGVGLRIVNDNLDVVADDEDMVVEFNFNLKVERRQ